MGNSQSSNNAGSSRFNNNCNFAKPTLPTFTPMAMPKYDFQSVAASRPTPKFEMPKFELSKPTLPTFTPITMPKHNFQSFVANRPTPKFEMPKFELSKPALPTFTPITMPKYDFQSVVTNSSTPSGTHSPDIGSLPTPSTTPEGTLSVLKKAVGGDPAAQQEMRLKFPKIAELSDATNAATENLEAMTRGSGLAQVAVGLGQAGVAITLAETGVGIPLATALLFKASDNIVAGSQTAITGKDTPTVVHEAARSIGLNDTAATIIDIGSDIILPSAPTLLTASKKIISKTLTTAEAIATETIATKAIQEITPKQTLLTFQHDLKMAQASKNATVIEEVVSSSKPRVTGQPQATSSSHNATTFNAHKSINKKFSALENAQKDAVRIQELPDGRIRYYTEETFSTNPGPTRGSSYVTEYNPNNGQIRSWMECYDHSGNVNRVHPKMLDGQDLKAQHYPPTKSELESFSQNPPKPRGPQ